MELHNQFLKNEQILNIFSSKSLFSLFLQFQTKSPFSELYTIHELFYSLYSLIEPKEIPPPLHYKRGFIFISLQDQQHSIFGCFKSYSVMFLLIYNTCTFMVQITDQFLSQHPAHFLSLSIIIPLFPMLIIYQALLNTLPALF